VNPHAVREFVSRSWHDATSAKLAYWADLFRTNPGAVWESAQSLRAYVSNVRAGFPTSEERDADLRHHLLLRSRLDSAAHAFCRR
jgi:hypothetical protein